jgi:hypothetical protein
MIDHGKIEQNDQSDDEDDTNESDEMSINSQSALVANLIDDTSDDEE